MFEMPQTGLFLVTRYEENARTALHPNTATFSSRPSPGASRAGGRGCGLPPRHHRARLGPHAHVAAHRPSGPHPLPQAAQPGVHPARVKELTPRIEEIATSLVDGFAAAGRCEFVSDFALPLPGILIAEQIGLSPSEYKTFRRWADAMLSLAQRPMSVDEAVAEAEIEVEAQHFLAEEFERRRADPTDDLISLLVNAHGDDEEPFTVQELQDLMHQLITGGLRDHDRGAGRRHAAARPAPRPDGPAAATSPS